MRAPAGVLFALAAAVTLGGCAGIGRPGPPGPTHAVTDSPSVGTTAPSVATSGTGRTTPGSTLHQVSTWWRGGGQGRANWILTDLGDIGHDSSTDLTAVSKDCTALSTDVAAARSYGPVPDAQAQHHWSAALDTYQQAATDCAAGVAAKNEALITKAGTDGQAGTSELDLATARIMRLINAG